MTIDPHLTPDDAAVALRSFPRRFRDLVTGDETAEDRTPDERAGLAGADGRTVADHVAATTAIAELAVTALGSSTAADALADPAALAAVQGSADGPVDEVLDRLTTATSALAERVDRVPNDAWAGEVSTSTGAIGRLDALRHVVSVSADHLRAAQRILERAD